MRLEVKLKDLILLLTFISVPFLSNAQSLEEAQKMYNAGVTAKGEGNIQEAIDQFTACAEACEILYEEEEDETAENLMYSVQGAIPSLYLQLGADQIKNKQVSEGLINLYKAKELAENYGDVSNEKKAEKYITQVHYKLGASKYKAADYAAAHEQLDKAILVDPDFVSAYYLKAVVYKKEGNEEMFKSIALKGIEVADKNNDSKNKEKLVNLGKGYYLKKGNDAKGASNFDEAIASLKSALEFDPTDATTLFLLSSSYLGGGDYASAIETGNKAIENERGNDEDKAKVYMIIAEAQTKAGDTGAACETYKKAAVGQYEELAKYRIEHELKCE